MCAFRKKRKKDDFDDIDVDFSQPEVTVESAPNHNYSGYGAVDIENLQESDDVETPDFSNFAKNVEGNAMPGVNMPDAGNIPYAGPNYPNYGNGAAQGSAPGVQFDSAPQNAPYGPNMYPPPYAGQQNFPPAPYGYQPYVMYPQFPIMIPQQPMLGAPAGAPVGQYYPEGANPPYYQAPPAPYYPPYPYTASPYGAMPAPGYYPYPYPPNFGGAQPYDPAQNQAGPDQYQAQHMHKSDNEPTEDDNHSAYSEDEGHDQSYFSEDENTDQSYVSDDDYDIDETEEYLEQDDSAAASNANYGHVDENNMSWNDDDDDYALDWEDNSNQQYSGSDVDNNPSRQDDDYMEESNFHESDSQTSDEYAENTDQYLPEDNVSNHKETEMYNEDYFDIDEIESANQPDYPVTEKIERIDDSYEQEYEDQIDYPEVDEEPVEAEANPANSSLTDEEINAKIQEFTKRYDTNFVLTRKSIDGSVMFFSDDEGKIYSVPSSKLEA